METAKIKKRRKLKAPKAHLYMMIVQYTKSHQDIGLPYDFGIILQKRVVVWT